MALHRESFKVQHMNEFGGDPRPNVFQLSHTARNGQTRIQGRDAMTSCARFNEKEVNK